MKLKNIKELEEKKAQLKSEIKEMEEVLSFKNPRKSLGIMTNGFTDKYLEKAMDSKVGESVLPIAGNVLKTTLKVGGAKVFNNVVKKHINKTLLRKGLLVAGGAVATIFAAKKIKQKVDEFQQEETAKSLEKLI